MGLSCSSFLLLIRGLFFHFIFYFLMRLKCGLLSLSWFEWKFDLNMGWFFFFVLFYFFFLFRILSILTHTEREEGFKKTDSDVIQKVGLPLS